MPDSFEPAPSTHVKSLNPPMLDGIRPLTSVSWKRRSISELSSPSVAAGRVPETGIPWKFNCSSCVSCPMEGRIIPERRLLNTKAWRSEVSVPSVSKRPEISVLAVFNVSSWGAGEWRQKWEAGGRQGVSVK